MSEVQKVHLPESVQSFFRRLAGDADLTAVELLRLVKMTANLYDTLLSNILRSDEMSGARWHLLLRLFAEETRGARSGISPTYLSRCMTVSKNTISAQLRGLEEQGLIERTLDAVDKRVFRIRLTEAGRQMVESTAPQHLAYLNSLADDLTPAEQAQLRDLLARLFSSLARRSPQGGNDPGISVLHGQCSGGQPEL